MSTHPSELCPAQQTAATAILDAIAVQPAVVLQAKSGMGRTTILNHLHTRLGGAIVGAAGFLATLEHRHPAAIEEAFVELVARTLDNHNTVLIDDLHLVRNVVQACDYARQCVFDIALTALLDNAAAQNKKLIFAGDDETPPDTLHRRAASRTMPDLDAGDYRHLCAAYLAPAAAAAIDFDKVHRFGPSLNAWQLRNACLTLAAESALDTETLIARLDISSNVEINEVRQVTLHDLKGVDEVIEALETKIVLPLENHDLAEKLRLKPRRGVLLAGPPGTGKTTIGRALAHRLKGKFFLIDGTVVAGSHDFYWKIRRIFEDAARNAPSVVFIDDTDLIFEGDKEQGFYRYLLTMLDGIESNSNERVCVMMTAMEPGSLPAALLRSGRIELWLETRLPDAPARAAIARESLAALPPPVSLLDLDILVAATHGLTGADLKAVIEDAKLLYARDEVTAAAPRAVEDYFLDAIDTLRQSRRTYGRRKAAPFAEAVRIGFSLRE